MNQPHDYGWPDLIILGVMVSILIAMFAREIALAFKGWRSKR